MVKYQKKATQKSTRRHTTQCSVPSTIRKIKATNHPIATTPKIVNKYIYIYIAF